MTKLKKLLDERNLSQVDLVKKTGIRSGTINRYVCGTRSPNLKNAIIIAKALDIPVEDLLNH